MRILLTIAALAAGLSVTAASAQNYVQGGPVQQGNMCNISTTGSDGYFGYVAPCAPQVKIIKKRHRKH
ncbi:MAG: hypothetical protein GC182_17670 [Rhodopseudomonas sp.]|nr:hypothetical protein [Rhodopseudomonas sp.]